MARTALNVLGLFLLPGFRAPVREFFEA